MGRAACPTRSARIRTSRIVPTLAAILLTWAAPAGAQTILVEAEGFTNVGGWVIDQQFMDQMGSPMLLAIVQGNPPAGGKTRAEVKPPDWLKAAGPNLARAAKVTVSSCLDEKKYPAAMINDGRTDITKNDLRWVSDKEPPHQVHLAWPQPQTLSAVRILTGWCRGGSFVDPMTDFSLEYHDGSAWKPIGGAKATGNAQIDWHAVFPAVRTDRVRLTVTAGPGGLARIWELELYNLPPQATTQPKPAGQ